MQALNAVVISLALAVRSPALAQDSGVATAKSTMTIMTHLDLNSFPNSTGPRRQRSAHRPADYGFTKIESFSDGWMQLSQPDGSWHIGALLLQKNKASAILCFTDSAGNDGTYRSTQVLAVKLDADMRWAGFQMPDRSDCKNLPPYRKETAVLSESTPAAKLQHLDDFRDSLSSDDRHRLDQVLPRSAYGGVAHCDDAQGSGASCEAAAYMRALHNVGLMQRFLVWSRHIGI